MARSGTRTSLLAWSPSEMCVWIWFAVRRTRCSGSRDQSGCPPRFFILPHGNPLVVKEPIHGIDVVKQITSITIEPGVEVEVTIADS
ncbi:Hypothetical predicted protein [Olea europaea subsp. europaea]|uniref:Uncharacterized protein n=1 Tax=Olea europaea subsp. europaea TaxID=158383 RepID=A0A8S0S9D9_OLEEU|nr:Hypothetical predicted protein [Olea europaea subsp. europaea]